MAEPWSDGDVLTAAHLAGLPWGVMGYVLGGTSDQTGISAVADVTGLSVTFTAVSTRLYRTTVYLAISQQTSGGTVAVIIADGASTQVNRTDLTLATNDAAAVAFAHLETGASGSITRKVRVSTSAGTMTVRGAAALRAYILVEDLGAA